MSMIRIVATNATRFLPVPNLKTFPMTGAVRSVARQRKVSVASRKKISIQAGTPFGASFFIMGCTDLCRQGMKGSWHSGVFVEASGAPCRARIRKGLSWAVLFLLPAFPRCRRKQGVQANRCALYTGWRAALSLCLQCHALAQLSHPLPAQTGAQRDACVA